MGNELATLKNHKVQVCSRDRNKGKVSHKTATNTEFVENSNPINECFHQSGEIEHNATKCNGSSFPSSNSLQ